MLLTSLMSLALSISTPTYTGTTAHGSSMYAYSGYSTDYFYRFSASCTFNGSSSNTNLSVVVEFHPNENLNESFDVEAYYNGTYIEYEWGLSVLFNYNLSCYLNLQLTDLTSNTTEYYSTPNQYMVRDMSLPFFASPEQAPVRMSYTFDSAHTYQLYIYGFILLTPNLDWDSVSGEGYSDGFNDGYNTGHSDGYTEGYNDGYNDGDTNGYQTGYDTGKTDGYNQGYNVALNTHSFSFTNLFASISDTPILMLRRLFGFELFGVELMSVFMSLFTALIVIIVIKRVFK